MALPDAGAVVLDSLKSYATRDRIGELFGSSDRRINRTDEGFFEVAGSIIKDIFNRVRQSLGFGQWGMSTMISWIQSGFNYIWNFNWNSTDAQLNQQIESAKVGLYGLLGAGLGNQLGYTTCGIVPGAAVTVFAPEVGVYILKEVGEEMLQEAIGYIATIIQSSFYLAAQTTFVKLFQSNRQLFNGIVNGLGSVLDFIIPGNLSWQKYRQQRDKTGGLVSFADFVEESIETLPAPEQAFWENFFEEFGDACWEALYVIAGSVDNFLARSRLQKEILLGPNRRIEVTPNREAPTEKMVFVGPEELVKESMVTTMGHYGLVEGRDIGQFVGEPAEDYALAKRLGLRIKLVLYPYPEPPFYRGERIKPRQVTINVPDVIRSKLDYQDIRAACGGDNGYVWGEFLAIGHLDNGRQMHVYGASENEAEQQLKLFLTLSEAKIKKLSISKVKNEGEMVSNPSLKRIARRVYPGHLTIWNRNELVSTLNAGRSGVRGNFFDKSGRIIIWPDSKPFGFDEVIRDVLTRGVPGLS
jgi:hypothetical protein